MNADKFGSLAEQTRHRAQWRTAEKGEPRCDGCEFADISGGGNGGAKRVHCSLLDVATKPNATCDKPDSLIHIKRAKEQANWRIADAGKARCNTCEFFGDNGDGAKTHCFALEIPTSADLVCDHHEIKEEKKLVNLLNPGGLITLSPEQLKEPRVWTDDCTNCRHHAPHDQPDEVWCDLWNRTSPTGWGYRCAKHEPEPETSTLDDSAMTTKDKPETANGPLAANPKIGTEIEAYDKWRVVSECKGYMSQSAEAMLEAGKRLIQLKEHEPHGEFERIVEQELGLPTKTARRMMQTAIKFMGPQLDGSKRSALSVLGKTKMFELLTEDDENLDQLAQGGTLAGKTLDEIERMTSRELRSALRKERAEKSLREDALAKDLKAAREVGDQYAKALREEKEKNQGFVNLGVPAQQASAIQELQALTMGIYSLIGARLHAKCNKVLSTHQGDLVTIQQGRLLVAQALGQVINSGKLVSMALEITPQDDVASPFDAIKTPAEMMAEAEAWNAARETGD